jgi:hypothetical protein
MVGVRERKKHLHHESHNTIPQSFKTMNQMFWEYSVHAQLVIPTEEESPQYIPQRHSTIFSNKEPNVLATLSTRTACHSDPEASGEESPL